MSATLRVVVPSRLAPGFRLAGAQVEVAEDAAAAAKAVRAILDSPGQGVVAIHEPFFATLPAVWQTSLEPLLVAIPEGIREEDPAGRRARLTAILERAIGYHFVFGERAP